MVTKQHRSPHVGKIRTVSLKLTSNFHLVGVMFVYSSLVALCYVEFTVLTVVFFLRFWTRPVLEAGLYLSVLTTPPWPL